MNDALAKPRLRRKEVPAYLLEKYGVQVSASTLAKKATLGGGPAIEYFGRIPLYSTDALDQWVAENLGGRVHSTAERKHA
ncbi:hypothetical protein [Cucumibacter marinus]|uniref:hypothetical protein n=1 Tax=Cucumibacter marinus TaxID=1121252 RepID=UPI0004068820|nr:hypothetical protein [Cucumibacter marinus]